MKANILYIGPRHWAVKSEHCRSNSFCFQFCAGIQQAALKHTAAFQHVTVAVLSKNSKTAISAKNVQTFLNKGIQLAEQHHQNSTQAAEKPASPTAQQSAIERKQTGSTCEKQQKNQAQKLQKRRAKRVLPQKQAESKPWSNSSKRLLLPHYRASVFAPATGYVLKLVAPTFWRESKSSPTIPSSEQMQKGALVNG